MKLDKIRFARLIGWISTQAGYRFNDADLYELDEIVDLQPPAQEPYRADATAVDELLAFMMSADSSGFIPAIKAYRAITGVGLKEAKEAVERYRIIRKQPEAPKHEHTLGDMLEAALKKQ